MPLYTYTGRFDQTTPAALATAYVENLKAPERRVIMFEESAHFAHIEEPKRFLEVLSRAAR